MHPYSKRHVQPTLLRVHGHLYWLVHAMTSVNWTYLMLFSDDIGRKWRTKAVLLISSTRNMVLLLTELRIKDTTESLYIESEI